MNKFACIFGVLAVIAPIGGLAQYGPEMPLLSKQQNPFLTLKTGLHSTLFQPSGTPERHVDNPLMAHIQGRILTRQNNGAILSSAGRGIAA